VVLIDRICPKADRSVSTEYPPGQAESDHSRRFLPVLSDCSATADTATRRFEFRNAAKPGLSRESGIKWLMQVNPVSRKHQECAAPYFSRSGTKSFVF
jgi:hypothetical protein